MLIFCLYTFTTRYDLPGWSRYTIICEIVYHAVPLSGECAVFRPVSANRMGLVPVAKERLGVNDGGPCLGRPLLVWRTSVGPGVTPVSSLGPGRRRNLIDGTVDQRDERELIHDTSCLLAPLRLRDTLRRDRYRSATATLVLANRLLGARGR
jgi:hypothetical protein